jgi:fucose permease
MVNKRSFLTLAAFLSLALNGMILTSLGTSLPAVQKFLSIDINQAGVLMAVLQAGLTIFSLLAGILSDYFRCERILLTGCLLLCLATMSFCTTDQYGINVQLIFVMGAGIGCILSGSNTLLISLYPARKGTILNIHHVFFGLGSLLGPLFIGYLIANGNLWREGFVSQAIILGFLGLLFLFSGGQKPNRQTRSSFFHQVGKLFGDREFRAVLLVNGLTMGSQVTILLLGVTFLIEDKMCTLPVAGTTLSVFSLFIMLGRLLCSRLILTFSHGAIVLTLLWLQLVLLIMALAFQGWLALIALALSGFSFSGIYPTALSLTGILFPKVVGSALGIISTVGSLGAMVLCWITGYVASLTDMGNGFIVLILASIAALTVFQLRHKSLYLREININNNG